MELDEFKTMWAQHEKILVEQTSLNKELLRKLLMTNAAKRIDWLKIRVLSALILPLPLFIFIVVPRIQFTPEIDVIIGTIVFLSLFVLSYIWSVKVYIQIERLNPNGPVTVVSKQLRRAEKYKLKFTRYSYYLAPFMIVGIFLSVGMPFYSTMMIPFYALMVISFLIGYYVRSKHGIIAQLRKIDRDIEEILELEMDAAP